MFFCTYHQVQSWWCYLPAPIPVKIAAIFLPEMLHPKKKSPNILKWKFKVLCACLFFGCTTKTTNVLLFLFSALICWLRCCYPLKIPTYTIDSKMFSFQKNPGGKDGTYRLDLKKRAQPLVKHSGFQWEDGGRGCDTADASRIWAKQPRYPPWN